MPTNEITQPTSNDSKEKIGAMGRAKIRRFALEAALRKKNGEEYLLNDEYLDYSPDDYPDCIAVTPGDTNNVDPELLNYFSKDGFLYYIDKTRKFHKLCTNIHVTALFRNADDEKWGMLITFVNQDKKEKEVIVYNSELIMPDANNVYKRLSDAGWNCFPRQFSLVIDYISRCMPKRRILLIEKSGWSTYNGEMIYTLPPDEIIGSKSITDVETRYVGNNKISFHKAGKLANWKKVVTLCEGNPILMTALGQAFVGPCLHFTGWQSGGFFLYGATSKGKTTALNIALSVYGNPSGLRYGRTTDNAAESIAEANSDGLLGLDDLTHENIDVIRRLLYTTANERGKARMSKNGNLRAIKGWKLAMIVTSEQSLATKARAIGTTIDNGIENRFVPIDIAMNEETGCVIDFHDHPDSKTLIAEIEKGISANHGLALIPFVKKLSRDKRAGNVLQELSSSFLNKYCDKDCAPEVERASKRFSYAYAALVYASKAKIIPFTQEQIEKDIASVLTYFYQSRGGTGSLMIGNVIRTFTDFILENESYFRQDTEGMSDDEKAHTKIAKWVGWKQINRRTAILEYLMLPKVFETIAESCKVEKNVAARILYDNHMLNAQKRQYTKVRIVTNNDGEKIKFTCYALCLNHVLKHKAYLKSDIKYEDPF